VHTYNNRADGVAAEEDKFFPKSTQVSIEEIPADTVAGVSIKRALYSVKRALYSVTRALNSA